MGSEKEPIEVDDKESEGLIVLKPVPACASGEGLPYAPQDFPNVGDKWRWKVGSRINKQGFMLDRYLFLPHRLQKLYQGRMRFACIRAIEDFFKAEYPDVDVKAFFLSFSWKVPSQDHLWDSPVLCYICPMQEMDAHSGSNAGTMKCKARNKICNIQLEEGGDSLLATDCDVCCSETGFCRHCCCILCSRCIDWACGGYSFIRCEGKLSEGNICGHAGHIECALYCYMAGTVGGRIQLDAEYHCRRCDHRTDLISHVERLLKTCASVDSRDDIEKILKMGLRILHGSQREIAKKLLNRIDLALTKLKSGVHLEDVQNKKDITSIFSSGHVPSSFWGWGRIPPVQDIV